MRRVVPIIIAALVLTSGPAAAQGLLQRGQELLNKALEVAPEGALSEAEIDGGLREALRVGTETVVNGLGSVDGFNTDPEVHIPLPGTLQTVQTALSRIGLSGLADDLELRMNRAAEQAVPEAKELFFTAINDMTLEDVTGILNGPQDAATRFFQEKMTPPLTDRFTPIVNAELVDAGATKAYDDMIGQYRAIPFVPSVEADLAPYVVEKALDGLFLYLAREEAAIRSDPAKRTTEILKKVFGA